MRQIRPLNVRFSLAMLVVSTIAMTALGQGAAPQDPEARGATKAVGPSTHAAGRSPSSARILRRHIVRQGIAVDLEIEPVEKPGGAEGSETLAHAETAGEGSSDPVFREGDAIEVRFKIYDTHFGDPLTSLYPAAWMDLLPPFGVEAPSETCQEKVEAFVGGTLLAQPELDLNAFYVLALNDDATISVVDPLFGFGNSKLLAMAFLEKPGYDWALTDDQQRLFVSMPEAGKIAVVDTASWEVVANVEIGERPWRLALQPDEHYLWVAYREPSPSQLTSGVAAVDTRTLEPVAHIPTGRGVHDMVIGGQDRYLFVSNREDATVSVIDIGKLEKIRDITTAQEPFGLAYSEVGGAVYVSHRAGGVVTAIDEDSLEVTARLEAEPGLEMIRFAPDGDRLGYVVNPAKNLLHIIDPATQRIIQTGVMEDGPDQVAFSDELVYVRHRGTGTVLMIPRDEVGEEGAPVPVVDFPGGQHPPGQMKLPTPAESIVQAPGATAVLVANPGDQAIYYYKEGMAAPMGNFQNYERQPRAIRVIDRSLQEIRPGVYQTAVKLRRPGRYDLAFFLDSPRLIHCFSLNVGKNPAIELERMGKTRAFEVRYETAKTHFEVGEEVSLRFEVRDALSGDPKNGVDDIQVLAFLAPGIWQKHLTALALDDGGYEVRFQLPREGVYYVFVQSRSLGFAYQSSPYITLMAGELAVQPPGTARAAELGGEQDGKKDGKKKD